MGLRMRFLEASAANVHQLITSRTLRTLREAFLRFTHTHGFTLVARLSGTSFASLSPLPPFNNLWTLREAFFCEHPPRSRVVFGCVNLVCAIQTFGSPSANCVIPLPLVAPLPPFIFVRFAYAPGSPAPSISPY